MTLRPRDRIALGVVIVAVAIGAFYMLALKPEQQKAKSLDASIAAQQQTVAQEQQAYNAGRQAQATIKAQQAEWTALHVAVPAQSNIPALLRILAKNAKDAHVKMSSITLASASGGAPAPTATATAGATGVPVQLTFAGGYAALNALVHRLDSLVVLSGNRVRATGPLMSISNVSLSGSPDLTVQLNATIYQLSAATTAAGATTGGQP